MNFFGHNKLLGRRLILASWAEMLHARKVFSSLKMRLPIDAKDLKRNMFVVCETTVDGRPAEISGYFKLFAA